MKNYFYIAVAGLLIFGTTAPPARAASTLFTLSSGGTFNSPTNTLLTYVNSGFTLVLAGYSCGGTNTLCSTDAPPATPDKLYQQSAGLGMADDNYNNAGTYEIPRNEFVQVDFSAVPSGDTITSIVFNFNTSKTVDGWDIYKSTAGGEFDSDGSAGPVAQYSSIGGFSTFSNSSASTATITTSAAGFYDVTALQADCEAVLTSITVNYSTGGGGGLGGPTPEPGTCLLMGVALLGLGVVGKKLRSRS